MEPLAQRNYFGTIKVRELGKPKYEDCLLLEMHKNPTSYKDDYGAWAKAVLVSRANLLKDYGDKNVLSVADSDATKRTIVIIEKEEEA